MYLLIFILFLVFSSRIMLKLGVIIPNMIYDHIVYTLCTIYTYTHVSVSVRTMLLSRPFTRASRSVW